MKERLSFPQSEDFSETIKEKNEPVKNLVESFEKLYYFKSKVTHASSFDRSETDREGRERPLFLRKRRADILDEINKTSSREEKEKLIAKANSLDEITAQYLNQQDVFVSLPEFGEEPISARVATILAPEECKNKERKDETPIFFIPGISNDIECVNNTIAEMALQGRDVITVGYPEGFSGHITNGFVEALEKESGVEAHTKFFKEVFSKIQKEYGGAMELWGLSMGSPIVAQILNDPEFKNKVSQAVLLFPAQSINTTSSAMTLGAIKEADYLKDKAATINWTVGTNRKPDSQQLKLRKKVLDINFKKMLKKDESWKTASVKDDGKVIIVSGLKDDITKSYLAHKEFESAQNNIQLLTMPEAHHMTINSEPENVIPQVLEFAQGWPYYVSGKIA